MQAPRHGYTRTEILAVLALLTAVAALVFPALATPLERAHSALCLSNLDRIGQAMTLYVIDNDGAYPPTSSPAGGLWIQIIQPTRSTASEALPHCPDAIYPALFDQKREVNAVVGYAYNITLSGRTVGAGQQGQAGRSEARVRYPDSTVVAFDARAGVYALSRPDVGNPWKNGVSSGLSVPSGVYEQIAALPDGARRHRGGANYLLADGHARWLRPEQVRDAARGNDGHHPSFAL
jgi:prepilin-type processing-associated H-X9-DG protein